MEQKKITFNRDLNKAMKFASQKALVENKIEVDPELIKNSIQSRFSKDIIIQKYEKLLKEL